MKGLLLKKTEMISVLHYPIISYIKEKRKTREKAVKDGEN